MKKFILESPHLLKKIETVVEDGNTIQKLFGEDLEDVGKKHESHTFKIPIIVCSVCRNSGEV